MEYPNEIEDLIAEVRRKIPDLEAKVLQSTKGEYWLVIFGHGTAETPLEWKRGLGFGFVTTETPAFLERPNEVYKTVAHAAARVVQLRSVRSGLSRLAEIRDLIGVTQVELAKRLRIGQSAVSQIEKGRDSRIETLRDYVEALGGELHIAMSFPDFQSAMEIPLYRTVKKVGTKRKASAIARR